MNFHNVKVNGVKKLVLQNMERTLELGSQNLFAPMLEELVINCCHDGILKIFSDEVLENQLRYLRIEYSSVDPSREGQLLNSMTNLKNLVDVGIHSMKNFRFEKFKSVTISLGPSIDGELSVLENVEFPELEHLVLKERWSL